jgi:DNA-binding response OmpR family regulator
MPKILIADDSRFQLTLLDRELKAKGFELMAAEDGLQASRLALRAQPDAIVLDLQMPGGSGLEVLKRLKRSAKTKSIPVIMLTANQEPETRERAISLGASEFLQKPVNLDELARKLSDLVKLTDSRSRASEAVVITASPVTIAQEPSPGTASRPSRPWRQILRDLDEEDRKQS